MSILTLTRKSDEFTFSDAVAHNAADPEATSLVLTPDGDLRAGAVSSDGGLIRRPATVGAVGSLNREALDAMVAAATVDCYNDSECVTGFYTMFEEHLVVPFQTCVLEIDVTVTGFDLADDDQIVATCARGQWRQRIPILDLPLPTPAPEGAEWIEAYRHWLK